jgi:ribosomal protein L11 methyltransferase
LTGSGVLALLALRLGAASAVGTDVDALAVRAAARNAELNGVADRFTSLLCDASIDGPEPVAAATGRPAAGAFGLVLANILRGPLVELAPRLAAYVRPGGRIVLSGILLEQAPEVTAAYEALGFGAFETRADSGWCLVTALRQR